MSPPKSPKSTRPHIPDYGISASKEGLLPWKWAHDRIGKSRQYWLATVRPDGAPHVMPVWGLWLDGAFYFSTGRKTRKARNLYSNPRCVVCSENAEEAVIVEGKASEVSEPATLKRIFAAYKKKYKMDVSGMNSPMYRVEPGVAFGLWEKKFPTTATRWKF